jgi:DNA mismatch endonuclease (patch repair protein)
MADTISREHRSWNMSRIKNRDTSPERIVRSVLHRMGFRFRVQDRKLPGRPDVVLPKHKIVVLVHGCFWHRHSRCPFAYTPKSNVRFWTRKFEGNVARDRRAAKALRALGWRVVTVWECQTADVDELSKLLSKRLTTFALTAKATDGRMPK